MSRRELVMAVVLVALLLVMGGAGLAYFFIVEPLGNLEMQVASEQIKLDKKKAEVLAEEEVRKNLFKVNPRLSNWNKISVPPRSGEKLPGVSDAEQKSRHKYNMQVAYHAYLGELMEKSGFKGTATHTNPDPKVKLDTPKKGEPTYERLAFNVKGKGSKDSVVKMLTEFHKEALLHQVRSLEITMPATPPGGGTAGGKGRGPRAASEDGLVVKMDIEAMLVRDAEPRTMLRPIVSYQPRVLSGRDYSALAKRNIFTGIASERPKISEGSLGKQSENKADVLRFMRLTMLYYDPDRDRWQGTLYDQAAGPVRSQMEDDDGNTVQKVRWESTLNTRLLSDLKISDRYGNLLLDAKVVHIDEKQLILRVDKKFYRLRCGDALFPAVERALSEEEVKELGLGD